MTQIPANYSLYKTSLARGKVRSADAKQFLPPYPIRISFPRKGVTSFTYPISQCQVVKSPFFLYFLVSIQNVYRAMRSPYPRAEAIALINNDIHNPNNMSLLASNFGSTRNKRPSLQCRGIRASNFDY